jgi:hypothetical protein
MVVSRWLSDPIAVNSLGNIDSQAICRLFRNLKGSHEDLGIIMQPPSPAIDLLKVFLRNPGDSAIRIKYHKPSVGSS